jgi:hypothetical protein
VNVDAGSAGYECQYSQNDLMWSARDCLGMNIISLPFVPFSPFTSLFPPFGWLSPFSAEGHMFVQWIMHRAI